MEQRQKDDAIIDAKVVTRCGDLRNKPTLPTGNGRCKRNDLTYQAQLSIAFPDGCHHGQQHAAARRFDTTTTTADRVKSHACETLLAVQDTCTDDMLADCDIAVDKCKWDETGQVLTTHKTLSQLGVDLSRSLGSARANRCKSGQRKRKQKLTLATQRLMRRVRQRGPKRTLTNSTIRDGLSCFMVVVMYDCLIYLDVCCLLRFHIDNASYRDSAMAHDNTWSGH